MKRSDLRCAKTGPLFCQIGKRYRAPRCQYYISFGDCYRQGISSKIWVLLPNAYHRQIKNFAGFLRLFTRNTRPCVSADFEADPKVTTHSFRLPL